MLNGKESSVQSVLKGKILKGTVVENKDPLHLGRVKIYNSILFSKDLDKNLLPWVMPVNFNSSTNGQCNFNVPDINTVCFVIYPSDDVYSGIYLTAVANLSQEFIDNYPYNYGFIDRSGSLFIVDTEHDNYTFYHVSGTKINIDGFGRAKVQITTNNSANTKAEAHNNQGITFEIIGDFNATCTGNFNCNCENYNVNASGSISLVAGSSYTVSSSSASINASSSLALLSNGDAKLSSTSGTSVASDSSVKIAGSSLSVSSTTGSATMSISGSGGYLGNGSGGGINFGGGRTSLDNHPLKDFSIEGVSFIAFDPSSTVPKPVTPSPASPTKGNVSSPAGHRVTPNPARVRQAYKEE